MRKRILGFVFAAALLAAMAVPLFGGAGTALAHEHALTTPNGKCHVLPQEPDVIHEPWPFDPSDPALHPIHFNVHKGAPGDNNPGNSQITIAADTNVNGQCG